MVDILQSGTVLYVRGVTHWGERRLIFQTLRELTGEKIKNSAKAWEEWAAQR